MIECAQIWRSCICRGNQTHTVYVVSLSLPPSCMRTHAHLCRFPFVSLHLCTLLRRFAYVEYINFSLPPSLPPFLSSSLPPSLLPSLPPSLPSPVPSLSLPPVSPFFPLFLSPSLPQTSLDAATSLMSCSVWPQCRGPQAYPLTSSRLSPDHPHRQNRLSTYGGYQQPVGE